MVSKKDPKKTELAEQLLKPIMAWETPGGRGKPRPVVSIADRRGAHETGARTGPLWRTAPVRGMAG
jgi:hypothetical protein